MKRGYYSIIRYVPDRFRKEFLNIGALVAFPNEGIFVFRIEPNNPALEKFDHSFDHSLIINAEIRFRAFFHPELLSYATPSGRTATFYMGSAALLESNLRVFDSTSIQFGTLNEVEFESEMLTEDLAEDFLRSLLERYVSRRKKARAYGERVLGFKEMLRQSFKTQAVLGTDEGDINNHLIVPSYRPEGVNVRFDFAYKNGALSLIETLDLSRHASGAETRLIAESGAILMKYDIVALVAEQKKQQKPKGKVVVNGLSHADNDAKQQLEVMQEKRGMEVLDAELYGTVQIARWMQGLAINQLPA